MVDTNTAVYIANLRKYNEGYLVGGWLPLPTTEDELQEFLEDVVQIDDEHEEYAIHDYETDLDIKIGQYDDIMELSDQIGIIERFVTYEYEALQAYIEAESHDLDDAIDCIQRGYYVFYPDIHDYGDLGERFFYEFRYDSKVPKHMHNYIDFESFGKDCGEHGTITSYGYFEVTN